MLRGTYCPQAIIQRPHHFPAPKPRHQLCLPAGAEEDSQPQGSRCWAQKPGWRWHAVCKRTVCRRAECNRRVSTRTGQDVVTPRQACAYRGSFPVGETVPSVKAGGSGPLYRTQFHWRKQRSAEAPWSGSLTLKGQ